MNAEAKEEKKSMTTEFYEIYGQKQFGYHVPYRRRVEDSEDEQYEVESSKASTTVENTVWFGNSSMTGTDFYLSKMGLKKKHKKAIYRLWASLPPDAGLPDFSSFDGISKKEWNSRHWDITNLRKRTAKGPKDGPLHAGDFYREFMNLGGVQQYPGAAMWRFNVRDVSEINPEQGTFYVEGWVDVMSVVPNDRKRWWWTQKIQEKMRAGDKEEWLMFPKFYLRNAVEGERVWITSIRNGEAIIEHNEKAGVSVPGGFVPCEGYTTFTDSAFLKGKFREYFEVQHFPFDVQDCTIVFSGQYYGRPLIPVQGFVWPKTELPDWQWLRPTLNIKATYAKKLSICYTMRFQRRHQYYVRAIMAPLFMINTLSFNAFQLENLEDRLTVTLTLLLTSIAFMLITTNQLPKVPYLTVLDKYVLVNFFLVLLIGLENFLWSLLMNYDGISTATVSAIDGYFGIILACMWGLFHVYFYIRFKRFQRKIKEQFGMPFQQHYNETILDMGVESSSDQLNEFKIL